MNFERRLRALEAEMISTPVILFFGDGTEQVISGGRDFPVRLLRAVCCGTDFSPGQTAELALIRRCADSKEPGGGHMIELLKCLLHARADA
jgi:hypothetical protein